MHAAVFYSSYFHLLIICCFHCITNENIKTEIHGRHDPCIVHRARVVVDSVTALVLCDLLSQKFGTDWLGEK